MDIRAGPAILRGMLLLLILACENPCQQICTEMAAYAQDECGFTVDDQEVADCKDSLAELPDGRAEACEEVNDQETIAEWWTCEELAENFQNGAG